MSIRLHIEACKKEGTEHFGSIGATCGVDVEFDPAVFHDPAAAVARIRGYYSFCETAMNEELARLRTGQPAAGTANGSVAAAAEAPPPKRPVARSPTTPLPAKRAAEKPVAEADGDAHEPEEDDPPTDGRRLLGWARSQPEDAKNWLVGLGKRLRYPNRILDWSPKQVQTAYQSYREAHRG
jgi:hypothetical protein